MNSLERVVAALSGRFADRRAWTIVLSLYGARLIGGEPERYFRLPKSYAAGQRAVVERFEPDIVFSPFALALEAEAYGADLLWPVKAPPNVRRPLRRELSGGLAPRAPGESASLSYLVEALRLTVEAQAGERPVAGILTAPTDLPALLFGVEAWLDILLFDRPLAAALVEVAVTHFQALTRAFFAAGAAFVACPVMFVNRRIIDGPLVDELLLPILARAFEGAGGPVVFHHGANPIQGLVGGFRDLPSVVGFVVDERDDFTKVRESLGPGKVILGGFSGPNMERRSPERIEELVRTALANRARDPSFILCSVDADAPWDTPPENIEAVRREVLAASEALV